LLGAVNKRGKIIGCVGLQTNLVQRLISARDTFCL